MKKVVILIAVLLTVVTALLYFLQEEEIKASIEIIKTGPEGDWAEFRLTNHGPEVYFVGEKTVPGCSEVKENKIWIGGSILCFPPETTLKSGESISFYGKSNEKGQWRYSVYLFKRDSRADWLRKTIEFLQGEEQEEEFLRVSSDTMISLKETELGF